VAEQIAAADRAAITVFRDMTPKQAARLLSFGVRRRERKGMRAEMVGELVNGAIPFFGGIFATLLGFRVLGRKPGANLKYDEWHNRFGTLLKVLGPLLVLFGVFLWIKGIVPESSPSNTPQAANWKRYTTSDGVCSAEFPQPPKEVSQSTPRAESKRLTLSLPDADIRYSLIFSDIPADTSQATVEERLDSIRDAMPVLAAQKGQQFKLVSEERISENGVKGRELEFAAGEKHTLQAKIFILGTRVYQMNTVTPRSKKADEETRRFLDSFRFEKSQK
jgi:hypothetical protein